MGKRLETVFRSVALFFLVSLLHACIPENGKTSDMMLPISPYSSPVWYPDGSMLGFNHLPFSDSDGFWLVNRDGSNMRRMTSWELSYPSWSPDGKWIAFSNHGQISKMPFDGTRFDTTQIIQLTNGFGCLSPTWSNAGDTIYFAKELGGPASVVYKMAADGSGQVSIGNSGPDSIYSTEPYFTSTDQIFHNRGDSISGHVFTMDGNGN